MPEEEHIILCAASAYTQKYYLNPDFGGLPDAVQKELQIACVLFTEDVGGIITLYFDIEGYLHIETAATDDDLMYDEIGADLKVKKLRNEHAELLSGIEKYYRVIALGEAL